MRKMDSAEEDTSTRRMLHPLRLRWSKSMEQLVIDLWEEYIDDYFGARKRRPLYEDMAESITEAGLSVQWTDVRSKLENLTKKYRIEKAKIKAHKGSPSRWRHYKKIHSLLNTATEARSASPENSKAEEEVESQGHETLNVDEFEVSLEAAQTDKDTQSELLLIAREQLQLQKEQQTFIREHQRAQLRVLKYIARSQDRLHTLLYNLITDTSDN